MEICDVYVYLENELKKFEPTYQKLEEKYLFYLSEAEKLDSEMTKMKTNLEALRKAKEALETGDFSKAAADISTAVAEAPKTPEVVEITAGDPMVLTGSVTGATASKKEDKDSGVRHFPKAKQRKGHLEVGQYRADGLQLNCWTSQASAARSLNWSQSGLSRFMRTSKEHQINTKGFYLEWVG